MKKLKVLGSAKLLIETFVSTNFLKFTCFLLILVASLYQFIKLKVFGGVIVPPKQPTIYKSKFLQVDEPEISPEREPFVIVKALYPVELKLGLYETPVALGVFKVKIVEALLFFATQDDELVNKEFSNLKI